MASLTTLLQTKYDFVVGNETNLEKGRIYQYASFSSRQMNFRCHVCWVAPSDGTATIEIWGAGGSGAEMCCCGFGIAGNPGAYSKKVITMAEGCFICSILGMPCRNEDDLCFRGCGEPTQVCWFGNAGGDGCMCVQGGMGGRSYCSTGNSPYCCFVSGGFCHTQGGDQYCGIICNFKDASANPEFCAQAYGGDVNCYGGFSCTSWRGCRVNCNCRRVEVSKFPPGMISTLGGEVHYTMDENSGRSDWSGMGGWMNASHGYNLATRSPTRGGPYTACSTGNRSCGCYQANGRNPFMPAGLGGQGPTPCDGVRDHAHMGGPGMIRIKFISTTNDYDLPSAP